MKQRVAMPPGKTYSKARPCVKTKGLVVGLPNVQEQLRMIDRLSRSASGCDAPRMGALAAFLSELYAKLQHEKKVTVHRFGGRSRFMPSDGAQHS